MSGRRAKALRREAAADYQRLSVHRALEPHVTPRMLYRRLKKRYHRAR